MLRFARRLRIPSTAKAAVWTGCHRSGQPVRPESGSGRERRDSQLWLHLQRIPILSFPARPSPNYQFRYGGTRPAGRWRTVEHGQTGRNRGWAELAQPACGRKTLLAEAIGLATARPVRWRRSARWASPAMELRDGTTHRVSSPSATGQAGTPAPAPPPPRNRSAGLLGTAPRSVPGPT